MRGVTVMKTLLGLKVLLELGSVGLTGFMNLYIITHTGRKRQHIKRPTVGRFLLQSKIRSFWMGTMMHTFRKIYVFIPDGKLSTAALKTWKSLNVEPFAHRTGIKINKILFI